jgi:putative oxidoreductase
MLLPLVILVELGVGLLVLIGWQTRLVALALAGFTILSTLIFHSNFADQGQSIHFMKNLAIAGGFLVLLANGAGSWSVDSRWHAPDRTDSGRGPDRSAPLQT